MNLSLLIISNELHSKTKKKNNLESYNRFTVNTF